MRWRRRRVARHRRVLRALYKALRNARWRGLYGPAWDARAKIMAITGKKKDDRTFDNWWLDRHVH